MAGAEDALPGPVRTADDLMALGDGAVATWALQAAAELHLGDALAGEPRDTTALAAATGTNPDALGRLLRYLASIGVVASRADRTWQLTPVGHLLQSGVEGSLRQWFVMGGLIWRTFFDAPLTSLRTGKPVFADVIGAPFFEYGLVDPAWGASFDDAMTGAAHDSSRAIVEVCDLTAVRRIIDIGGGRGHLLAAFLERNNGARGIVFDLPEVAARAAATSPAELGDRIEFVGGDFFEAVPAGDAYLLSWILHDWDDAAAVRILESCRRSIRRDGRLLIIESVVPDDDSPHPSKSLDLIMLLALGGRERTEGEYRDLLARAGFRLERTIPTASPMSVLEAVPA